MAAEKKRRVEGRLPTFGGLTQPDSMKQKRDDAAAAELATQQKQALQAERKRKHEERELGKQSDKAAREAAGVSKLCGFCRQPGHMQKTCPVKGADQVAVAAAAAAAAAAVAAAGNP